MIQSTRDNSDPILSYGNSFVSGAIRRDLWPLQGADVRPRHRTSVQTQETVWGIGLTGDCLLCSNDLRSSVDPIAQNFPPGVDYRYKEIMARWDKCTAIMWILMNACQTTMASLCVLSTMGMITMHLSLHRRLLFTVQLLARYHLNKWQYRCHRVFSANHFAFLRLSAVR